jgi:hypothetical protein
MMDLLDFLTCAGQAGREGRPGGRDERKFNLTKFSIGKYMYSKTSRIRTLCTVFTLGSLPYTLSLSSREGQGLWSQ